MNRHPEVLDDFRTGLKQDLCTVTGMTMSNAPKEVPRDKLELYEILLATIQDIERKGKTMPYTSHNGHMFTHLSKSGSLGIRLPKEEREAFFSFHI